MLVELRKQLEREDYVVRTVSSLKTRLNSKTSLLAITLTPLAACGGGGGGGGGGAAPQTNFVGTPGADTIDQSANASNLTMTGLADNDVLRTGRGNDIIRGGQGSDDISSGAGDDVVVIVGDTTAQPAPYTQADLDAIDASLGLGGRLANVLSVSPTDNLNNRPTEAVGAERVDGGTGTDTVLIFGVADLTGTTFGSIERFLINSDVTFDGEAFDALRAAGATFEGDFGSVLRLTSANPVTITAADLAGLTGINRLDLGPNITLVIADGLDLPIGLGVLSGDGAVQITGNPETVSVLTGIVAEDTLTLLNPDGSAANGARFGTVAATEDEIEAVAQQNFGVQRIADANNDILIGSIESDLFDLSGNFDNVRIFTNGGEDVIVVDNAFDLVGAVANDFSADDRIVVPGTLGNIASLEAGDFEITPQGVLRLTADAAARAGVDQNFVFNISLPGQEQSAIRVTPNVDENGLPDGTISIFVISAEAEALTFNVSAQAQDGAFIGNVDGFEGERPFSIIAGNDDDAFAIDPRTGVITLADSGELDAQNEPVRTLRIASEDPNTGETFVYDLTIRVTAVTLPPSLDPQAFTLDEGFDGSLIAQNDVIGTVVATPNDGSLTYAIEAIRFTDKNGQVSSVDPAFFSIDPLTGELIVGDDPGTPGFGFDFDFEREGPTPGAVGERDPFVTISVSVTNGTGDRDIANITIGFNDINEPVSGIDLVDAFDRPIGEDGDLTDGLADIVLDENTPGGAGLPISLAEVIVDDVDNGGDPLDPNAGNPFDEHVFSVSDDRFEVVNNTLRLKAGETLNFEVDGPILDVDITATDLGNPSFSFTRTQGIVINDLNDAPTDIDLDKFFAATSHTVGVGGEFITDLDAVDEDFADDHVISLVGGAAQAQFEIRTDAVTGAQQLFALEGTVFDLTQDSGRFFELTFDVAEISNSGGPLLDAQDITKVIELTPLQLLVPGGGGVQREDFDEQDAAFAANRPFAIVDTFGFLFGLSTTISGADANQLGVNVNDQTLIELQAGVLLDHEVDDTIDFTLTVTGTDGAGNQITLSRDFAVDVNDLNEAPIAQDLSVTIDEILPLVDGQPDDVVALIPVSDPDDNDEVGNPVIVAGNDDGIFGVDANTGEIIVVDEDLLSFENAATGSQLVTLGTGEVVRRHSLTVDLTDDGGFDGSQPPQTTQITVTIDVRNLNEEPLNILGEDLGGGVVTFGDDDPITPDLTPIPVVGVRELTEGAFVLNDLFVQEVPFGDVAPDPFGTYTFEITKGADMVELVVLPLSTGPSIRLKNGVSVDFNTSEPFEVEITARDGSGQASGVIVQSIMVAPLDVNENPDAQFVQGDDLGLIASDLPFWFPALQLRINDPDDRLTDFDMPDISINSVRAIDGGVGSADLDVTDLFVNSGLVDGNIHNIWGLESLIGRHDEFVGLEDQQLRLSVGGSLEFDVTVRDGGGLGEINPIGTITLELIDPQLVEAAGLSNFEGNTYATGSRLTAQDFVLVNSAGTDQTIMQADRILADYSGDLTNPEVIDRIITDLQRPSAGGRMTGDDNGDMLITNSGFMTLDGQGGNDTLYSYAFMNVLDRLIDVPDEVLTEIVARVAAGTLNPNTLLSPGGSLFRPGTGFDMVYASPVLDINDPTDPADDTPLAFVRGVNIVDYRDIGFSMDISLAGDANNSRFAGPVAIGYAEAFDANDNVVFEDGLFGLAGVLATAHDDVINGGLGGAIFFGNKSAGLPLFNADRIELIAPGDGVDEINGGSAITFVTYARSGSPVGIVADLKNGTIIDPFGNTDVISSIEGVIGTAGNDSFTGGDLNGATVGQFLNVEIFEPGAGTDVIDGGVGVDMVMLSPLFAALPVADDIRNLFLPALEGAVIDLTLDGGEIVNDGHGDTDTVFGIELFAGTQFADLFTGDDEIVAFLGAAGDDVILGSSDDDLLTGDEGTDEIRGGDGDDLIMGGTGLEAVLEGGRGNDLIFGAGNFRDADAAGIIFRFEEGRLPGEAAGLDPTGFDQLFSFAGGVFTPNLSLPANMIRETIDDRFDLLATNRVDGGAGNDQIVGGDGSDLLIGGTGSNLIHGGSTNGINFASYDQLGAGIVVDLGSQVTNKNGIAQSANIAGALLPLNAIDATIFDPSSGAALVPGAADVLIQINGLIGTAFDDILIGQDAELLGHTEGEYFVGGDGRDRIDGDNARARDDADSLGLDTVAYLFETGGAGIAVDLSRGVERGRDTFGNIDSLEGIDDVLGTAFDDSFIGSDLANVFFGGDGVDTYVGGSAQPIAGRAFDFVQFDLSVFQRQLADMLGVADPGPASGISVDFNVTDGQVIDDGFGNEEFLDSIAGIIGTRHADEIRGSLGDLAVAHNFQGQEGDDLIVGGARNDILSGDEGNDTIEGNLGDDLIFGGDGQDTINGDLGSDTIFGGDGDDVLRGGENEPIGGGVFGGGLLDGNDTINGGNGNDQLFGGLGGDTLRGGAGNDELFGEDDNDFLFGDNGDDLLFGGEGNDSLTGGNGRDTLRGGDDDDILRGGNDDDELFGETGDDILLGGAGNDSLDGGAGTDRIDGGLGDDLLTGGQFLGDDDFYNDLSGGNRFIYNFSSDDGAIPEDGLGFDWDGLDGDDTILNFDVGTGAGSTGRQDQILLIDDLGEINTFNELRQAYDNPGAFGETVTFFATNDLANTSNVTIQIGQGGQSGSLTLTLTRAVDGALVDAGGNFTTFDDLVAALGGEDAFGFNI